MRAVAVEARAAVANGRGNGALRKVGVPYTDEQIAKASEEVKGKTELEATIAYLQVLGLALK